MQVPLIRLQCGECYLSCLCLYELTVLGVNSYDWGKSEEIISNFWMY